MEVSILCPHLYTLDSNITVQFLQNKQQHSFCEWCPQKQESDSLWLCLHSGCLSVLCVDNDANHLQDHYMRCPAHMLILNLDNFRVWCHICRMEVTLAMRQHLQLCMGDIPDAITEEDVDAEEEIHMRENASSSSPSTQWADDDEEDEDEEDEKMDGGIYFEDKPRGAVGLRNLGMTCYMNAALQVLSNSPGVVGFFLHCEGALAGVRRQHALSLAYRDVVQEQWRTRRGAGHVAPVHLYQAFKQLHPMFHSFSQQDSQEFLRYFLDGLHEELRQPLPLQDNNNTEEDSCSDTSSNSESDAEELCSAVGSRSSLYESDIRRPGLQDGAEPDYGGATMSGRYQLQDEELEDEEGADSEGAKYETCDSGVSGDDSDVSSRSSIAAAGRKKKKHNNHSSRAPLTQGSPCDMSDTSSSGAHSPWYSKHSSSPHQQQQQPLPLSYPTSPRSSPRITRSHTRPQSPSPHRSPASTRSAPRSPALAHHSPHLSPRSPSSAKGGSRMTSSRSSGLGTSKPSLYSTDVFSASPSSSSALPRKKDQSNRGKGHRVSKKVPQQQYSSSVVSDLFDGQLISSVQCLTCNSVSSRLETFQDLSLPIPSSDHQSSVPPSQPQQVRPSFAEVSVGDSWVWWLWHLVVSWVWGPAVSLHHCLSAFFSADELKGDNMYSCEKCGKLRNGLKYSKVVKLPEVLVIHLKRFRHDYMFSSKINQHVAFPLTGLGLQSFLHRDCVSDVRQYSLYGVICHHGSVGGGHYTAMAQTVTTGDWFRFDDDYVTPVSADAVQRCQAYVLFYKKSSPSADTVRERARNIMQVAARQPSLVRFYISKQWYNKFLHFAECGPIDNSDFLCPHGGVQPRKAKYVASMVRVVREGVWEYLKAQFGGGPPCTRLYTCIPCTIALRALQHRQLTELESFKLLNSQSGRVYGVSLSWFRLWEKFVLDVTQLPPPAVDNTSVMKQYQQRGAQGQLYRSSLDYITITGDCWRFFQSIYGGGPEFCLQQVYEVGVSASSHLQHDYRQQHSWSPQQRQSQQATQSNEDKEFVEEENAEDASHRHCQQQQLYSEEVEDGKSEQRPLVELQQENDSNRDDAEVSEGRREHEDDDDDDDDSVVDDVEEEEQGPPLPEAWREQQQPESCPQHLLPEDSSSSRRRESLVTSDEEMPEESEPMLELQQDEKQDEVPLVHRQHVQQKHQDRLEHEERQEERHQQMGKEPLSSVSSPQVPASVAPTSFVITRAAAARINAVESSDGSLHNSAGVPEEQQQWRSEEVLACAPHHHQQQQQSSDECWRDDRTNTGKVFMSNGGDACDVSSVSPVVSSYSKSHCNNTSNQHTNNNTNKKGANKRKQKYQNKLKNKISSFSCGDQQPGVHKS